MGIVGIGCMMIPPFLLLDVCTNSGYTLWVKGVRPLSTSVLLVWLMKLPAKKVCHTTLKSTYVTTLTIFTIAKDLARLLSDSSVHLLPNFHLMLLQEDFCPTLVSLTPEMNFRTLSASMINQESNSAAIIPLLTLKLSLVSTLVNHHTKNREKIPGILLNFYLLIIKQERITVCLAN